MLEQVQRRLADGELACVGLGPRRNFRARRWWDPVVGGAPADQLVPPIEQFARLADVREVWVAEMHLHPPLLVAVAAEGDRLLYVPER